MNNFDAKVASIQEKRAFFINNFSLDFESLEKNLYSAISDNELNSIRLHKYMTETKLLGKVETARYLDSIGLNENTTIKDLSDKDIMELAKYLENK